MGQDYGTTKQLKSRTYPAWTRAVLQTVNIWLHRKSVALATVQASWSYLYPYFTHEYQHEERLNESPVSTKVPPPSELREKSAAP